MRMFGITCRLTVGARIGNLRIWRWTRREGACMYHIFSVDDHIIEPPDLWTSRVPARYVDEAPRVIERDGVQLWAYEDRLNTQIGLNAVAGKPRDQWNIEPARFADMIPGCYDPQARA